MSLPLSLWLVLSCVSPTRSPTPDPSDSPPQIATTGELVPLSAPRLLRRMSLDLRGVLPSIDELDAVEADPSLLSTYQAQYLQDARLEERLVAMFAEVWHTRIDEFDLRYADFHLDASQEYEFEKAVGEEPLRIMAYVAMNDRPWTEVVTADYTIANELLGSIWPIDYPDGMSGWQVARYTDGRPPVGVMASNGLWWRYTDNGSNMSRGRANALSRLLVCEEILTRPISFSTTSGLLESADSDDVVLSEAQCLSCHAIVEPLAASLFGFHPNESKNVLELTYYHPEREVEGQFLLNVQPAWFGTGVDSLLEMAHVIAADSRFSKCAAETMAGTLWRRPVELSDFDQIEALRQTFVRNGMTMRSLLAAILATPAYQAGSLAAGASDDVAAREMTVRMLSPNQLSTVMLDLTGFSWQYNNYEQMENDFYGYRVLTGGVSGSDVLRPQPDPGLTWALVVKRLAQLGAGWAVQEQLIDGSPGTGLLANVDLSAQPGDDVFDDALAELHWRLFAIRPDEARITSLSELWQAIEAIEGPTVAWQGVLGVMLRDTNFVSY